MCTAVVRDDRWGRTYEGFSEDPEIVREYAGRVVAGLQGAPGNDDFLGRGRVVATAKHFIGDGGTVRGVDQGDNLATEQELLDIHGQGYISALEAGVQTVMVSFNSWHGKKLHGHRYLLTDVLKEKMQFDGFLVSDWNGERSAVLDELLLGSADAVVVATGSRVSRRIDVPGSELAGIHLAMEYLPQANRVVAGDDVTGQIVATGKHVVILGGGDTGSDCLGTALRQDALSVTSLDIMERPPDSRPTNQPWPVDPLLFKVSSSHAEGGVREYQVSTVGFLGEDRVQGLRVSRTVRTPEGRMMPSGQTWDIPADLVILAMGFTGPETELLSAQTGADITGRGLIARGDDFQSSVPGVFVAGDAGRGQSLVVWAIAEGRAAAAGVDAYLRGGTELPVPVAPTSRPVRP